MSRIGKLPVPIPGGVTVKLDKGVLSAKGPLGELTVDVPREIGVAVEEGEVVVTRPSESKLHKSLHGLTRSLVNSAVLGVSSGFSKSLEIIGVGYRAEMKGKALVLHVGYSHPVTMDPPEGISFETPEATKVTVKGANKVVVGQIAANIRSQRPPEPYKGKGIKYEGEVIRRKAGKAAGR